MLVLARAKPCFLYALVPAQVLYNGLPTCLYACGALLCMLLFPQFLTLSPRALFQTCRIHILEKRLKRHEEQALHKYYELDHKLRSDPRLSALLQAV